MICGKFRDGDVRWAVADATAMKRVFGDKPCVSFEQGSDAVAKWLVAQGII